MVQFVSFVVLVEIDITECEFRIADFERQDRKLEGQRWKTEVRTADFELRIADLKKELPKHESQTCNFTLITTALLGLQFEIRNSTFPVVDPPLVCPCCCAIRNPNFTIVDPLSFPFLLSAV